MKLLEILEEQKEQYDHFVAGQPGGSFLQAFEWGEWQKKLGKDARRFFLLNDFEQTILSLQVLVNPLSLGRNYLYVPYGPVVAQGYELKVSDIEFLTAELKRIFSESLFLRLEPKFLQTTPAILGKKTANIQPAKSLVVNLNQTRAELLAAMHPKTRYNIKVAQKHGVEIQQEYGLTVGHGLYTKEAIELVVETAKRQGFVGHSKNYYRSFLDFFALYNEFSEVKVHVYKALYQQQLLTAAFMVDFGKTRTFLFGGSSAEFKNVMAPYLLHFQAMLDAKEQGLVLYDFWGAETASGKSPGFVRFKLGFGGQSHEYEGAKDLSFSKLWYNVYTLLRIGNRTFRKIFNFR